MIKSGAVVVFLAFLQFFQPSAFAQQPAPQAPSSSASALIVLPGGTSVQLALTNPLAAASAKVGASVYAQTTFPVVENDRMAIPPGTYLQGQIDSIVRPRMLSPHAQFQFHFTKLIFANGYAIDLENRANLGSSPSGPRADVIPAVATPYVNVSSSSDVLLNTGSPIEMILQVPLRIDAARVGSSQVSNTAQLVTYKSASLCRPIPGSPGTPDTVIPGTPGTAGTPDIVIPGGPGMPDTVIPGTPATPGTPDTVIPGTPGTFGIDCPAPPVVATNTKMEIYKEPFTLAAATQLGGQTLSAGQYEVSWEGPAIVARIKVLQNGNAFLTVPGRIVLLNAKPAGDFIGAHASTDGTLSLRSLRFAGQMFAVYFDSGAP
jgi:hypothetical protein